MFSVPLANGGGFLREVERLLRSLAWSVYELSERTVDRHVSNIFTKLGVSSRAAATATAYQSELI